MQEAFVVLCLGRHEDVGGSTDGQEEEMVEGGFTPRLFVFAEGSKCQQISLVCVVLLADEAKCWGLPVNSRSDHEAEAACETCNDVPQKG